ncbi:MAG: matrixin family metalloprotease [Candidatus Paceibacterota bacterium]
MRTPYAVTLLLALLLGGTYWFTQVEASCQLPLSYRIGDVDERFELTFDDVRIALVEAEAIWENATGKNLFRYDEDANLTINFVYDERQALTDAERTLREQLDESENINDTIDKTYAELVAEYSDLSMRYQDKVGAYERALNAYNEEVESYNKEGGAPPEVYEELSERKKALDAEQRSINRLASELNALVENINRIGEEGNQLVDAHNDRVERYNDTFADSHEFTQGDYQQRTINIYTWSDRTELLLVLAHEMGHAISLDHVENEESIMYYLMGGQPEELTPSAEDLTEFDVVCGDEGGIRAEVKGWGDRLSTWFRTGDVL